MKTKTEEQMKFLKSKDLQKFIQENRKIWGLYREAF